MSTSVRRTASAPRSTQRSAASRFWTSEPASDDPLMSLPTLANIRGSRLESGWQRSIGTRNHSLQLLSVPRSDLLPWRDSHADHARPGFLPQPWPDGGRHDDRRSSRRRSLSVRRLHPAAHRSQPGDHLFPKQSLVLAALSKGQQIASLSVP